MFEDEYYDSFDDQSDSESDAADGGMNGSGSSEKCTSLHMNGCVWWQCDSCEYTRQLRSTVLRHHKHVSTTTSLYLLFIPDFIT